MDENKETEQGNKKDFVSSPAFQKTIKRTKIKQITIYTLVSLTTIIIFIFGISILSNNLIQDKLDDANAQRSKQLFGKLAKGAGIIDVDGSYSYSFLSAEEKTTYYKKIGDRQIPWKIDIKRYPAFGKVENMNPTRADIYEVSHEERTIRYNYLNNEREVDFYYPYIGYHQLPKELKIATGLDENTLIEVALSFEKPMSFKELGEGLGIENVDWIWIDTSSRTPFNELGINEYDFDHLLYGENAYGYVVSKDNPYTNFVPEEKASGAIVSGTPSELERFLRVNFIRASVIGATVDVY